MKICLVNPPQFFPSNANSIKTRLSNLANFITKSEINASASCPPLGILYLGTILKNAGHEIYILDSAKKGWHFDKIIEWMKKKDPDVVGISVTVMNFLNSMKIAKMIRKVLPNSKIILGGPHPTFTADQILKEYPFIDVVVRGEADESILHLMSAFRGEKNLKDVDGISIVNNGKVIHTATAKAIQDLDKIPFPDRGLLDEEYINNMCGINFTTGKFTTILSSRGCPFGCTFCSCFSFRKICGFRSPENFINEIELLISQGYEEIGIVDDNFMLDRKRVEKICELIKKNGLKFHWWCEGRVKVTNYDLLKKVKSVGCETVLLGLESANQRILDYYRKNITPRDSIKTVKAAKKANVNTVGSFIVGAPIETKQEVTNTLTFMRKIGIDVPNLSPLGVNMGTYLWDQLTSNNPSLKSYWKTGFIPAEIGLCEYDLKWLNTVIGKHMKKFVLNPNFLVRETKKVLTDPYLVKMVRKMFWRMFGIN
jgi:radical SAM superfamily enzyme YgiQ (UPF0313 family)